MGSIESFETSENRGGQLGKIDAPLIRKLQSAKWGEYKLKDLFSSLNGDVDIQKKHINGRGDHVVSAGVANNGIIGNSDIDARQFESGTFTVDMFGYAFYRQFRYKIVTHARVFSLQPKFKIDKRLGLFITSGLSFLSKKFGYENMCSWEKIKSEKIQLPVKDDKIDFEFIDNFIAELETHYIAGLEARRITELEAYLTVTGFKDYALTAEEQHALDSYKDWDWDIFNLEELFGKSTRGKRLKSADRIPGVLPFVTAGETDEGISGFIGNDVTVFSENTTTIDMFGSAKYRNYKYGGDDHIAVVHTETLPQLASVFVTSAIHKSSHNGRFDYSRNFYAKDADALDIQLPSRNGQPDYDHMSTFVSAIQKVVIKDVVLFADRKIGAAKEIVNK